MMDFYKTDMFGPHHAGSFYDFSISFGNST